MKSKTFLIISTFLISFVLSCDSKGSTIVRALQEIQNSLPELIEQVKNMKECQTPALKSICSKGYSYWHSLSEANYYKGIGRDKENIETFFAVLLDGLPIEKEDAKKILPYFKEMVEAGVEFLKVLGLDLIYNKNATESAKKGCYFSIFMESNCENKNQIDVLFTSINTGIQLGKDIFILEEGSGNFFEGSYEQKPLKENEDLSKEQYNALFKLLQISSYSNAAELIKQLGSL